MYIEEVFVTAMKSVSISFQALYPSVFLHNSKPHIQRGKTNVSPWCYPPNKNPRKLFTCKGLRFVLAVRTGLEPATPCVTGMYSNQLNYQTIPFGTANIASFVYLSIKKVFYLFIDQIYRLTICRPVI